MAQWVSAPEMTPPPMFCVEAPETELGGEWELIGEGFRELELPLPPNCWLGKPDMALVAIDMWMSLSGIKEI